MSEFFVKTFNQKNKCAGCSRAKLKIGSRIFSLCEGHLVKAREGWRSWAAERRAEGKCISCKRKSFNGWLRCRKHREINRLKCEQWMKAHPEHPAEAWAKRKAFLALGVCLCKSHTRLPAGKRRCDACRARQRAYR